MKNFWKSLKKPFFVLAPMDDVTDVVFRDIVTKTARPDVFFTEFTNVEGLQSAGRPKLISRLKFKPNQHPIVAQIWGKTPENYEKTARELVEMGFDGIDINMGCPEKNVCRNGCCSALINNPDLAKEIIAATKKGAGKLPVSVKTRIGFNSIKTEEWAEFLLKQGIQALTIHGRTAKQKSNGLADWNEIHKVVEIRDRLGVDTVIIGNGDVKDFCDGVERAEKYGVDGIMIGRGIFGNLWSFSKNQNIGKSEAEMLSLLLDHARSFENEWGRAKNFLILRRFFKIYVSSFANAAKIREQLMQTQSLKDVEEIVSKHL
jgi:nifR3 family TIM-barrel protein